MVVKSSRCGMFFPVIVTLLSQPLLILYLSFTKETLISPRSRKCYTLVNSEDSVNYASKIKILINTPQLEYCEFMLIFLLHFFFIFLLRTERKTLIILCFLSSLFLVSFIFKNEKLHLSCILVPLIMKQVFAL